jgi:hypothetical protein
LEVRFSCTFQIWQILRIPETDRFAQTADDTDNPVTTTELVNDFNGFGAQADNSGWIILCHSRRMAGTALVQTSKYFLFQIMVFPRAEHKGYFLVQMEATHVNKTPKTYAISLARIL